MHRSKLGVILFDHPKESFDSATRFWGAALGANVEPDPDSEFTTVAVVAGIELASQRLGQGAPRVHPDIETDDIEAEVDRLIGLGASITRRIEGCTIMADPGGLVFCVVGVQNREQFDQFATTWP